MNITSTTIKRVRQWQRLTQQQFADVLGVTARSVRGWELGSNSPRGKRLKDLQRLVGRMEKEESK